MQHNEYIYKRFIKIILPICIFAFVFTIALFELTNFHDSRDKLVSKLDKLSSTYSLLYAEPVAAENMDLIKSYSVALISDPEIAMIRIESADGEILDEFESGRRVDSSMIRTLSINYADEDGYRKVGTLTLGVCTNQIHAALVQRVKSEFVLLIVLIASVLASVGIAFQRSVDGSLRKLTHQASHDPLTDLINRRAFENMITNTMNQRRITDYYHKLLYLDLDGFKQINDTNGHIAGDELLKQISSILTEQTRKGDLIARLGGDEFGVLLHNCSTEMAISISEKFRSAIENHEFSWNDKVFKIGVSIGIATMKDPDIRHEEYIRMADEACYAAKRGGRNRIQLYETLNDIAA